MEARDSFCFPKNTKNPNPSPIRKKFGFCCCGAPPGTRTLGPLIKRNQRATIINFRNYANSSFLAFCRKLTFCIRCILCTCCSLLHPLSSCSGVQKVCKNVQSQNQPLKTGSGFLCKTGKTAGFQPDTAATILPVQTKHQMYINNYDSWQGFGQLRSLINPKQLFLCGLFWVEIPRGFTFLFYRQRLYPGYTAVLTSIWQQNPEGSRLVIKRDGFQTKAHKA